MIRTLSAPRDRAKRAGMLCGLGIFISYVAIVFLSWETSLGQTGTALSIGNLGLGHVFLPGSLHVVFLALPPVLFSTLGVVWIDAAESLTRSNVMVFLRYAVVFPLIFAGILAFGLGVASFIGEVSLSVGGIVSLLAVGLFSAISTFSLFIYLELFVVPGAALGTSIYLLIDRLV